MKNYFLGDCRVLMPIFEAVSLKYRNDKSIVFAKIDLAENKPKDLGIEVSNIKMYLM